MIILVNDRFAAAVEYQNYHVFQRSSLHEDDVANELQRMAKKIVVQLKDHIFSSKDMMSVVTLLQSSSRRVMHAVSMKT